MQSKIGKSHKVAMNQNEQNKTPTEEVVISAEALKKAEEFIEEEEGAANRLTGKAGVFITAVAVIMSVFHLYAAYGIVPTQILRLAHVGFVLFLSFLLFPLSPCFCWCWKRRAAAPA